jgi:hypothetical protein
MTAYTNHSMTFYGTSLVDLFEKITIAGQSFMGGTSTGAIVAATPVADAVDPKALSTNDAVQIAKGDALVVPPTAAAAKKAAKLAAEEAAAKLAAEQAAADADVLGEATEEEAPEYTLADVRTALGLMREAHGKNKPNLLTEFISQFGVTMASQLKPEQFADAISKANNYKPGK